MTNQVLLPKTTIAQKLDRNLLFNFCNFIQEKVEILSKIGYLYEALILYKPR